MSNELTLLTLTAASIGFLHTLLGPDHYLPFVFMAQAGRWSRTKTVAVTLACGVGHVLSSVVLGVAGIALGLAVSNLEAIQAVRGQVAGYVLIAFGLVYLVWGLRRAARQRPHSHLHRHADGTVHVGLHVHQGDHLHVHTVEGEGRAASVARLSPWFLFTIFVFGPCESLIPLLMYPAARGSYWGVALVTLTFAAVTLATMLAAVLVCAAGVQRVPRHFAGLERYTHALAGGTLAFCGAAIQFLGL